MSENAESAKSVGADFFRTLFRAFLVALSVALVWLTAGPALKTVREPSAPRIGGEAGGSNPFHTVLAPGCETFTKGEDHRATLIIDARRLDSANSTLVIGLELCVPLHLLNEIHAAGGSHQAAMLRATTREGYQFRARAAYSHVAVGTFMNVFSGARYPLAAQASRPVPEEQLGRYTTFGRLVSGVPSPEPGAGPGTPGGPVSLGTIKVPVLSEPNRYPFDWYSAFFTANTEISSRLIGIRDHRQHFYSGLLPNRIVVTSSATLRPLQLRVGVSSAAGQNTNEIRLNLTRSSSVEQFVTVVALIPGVLALVLGIWLLFVRRVKEFGPEGVVGIVALLLAVLPIRAVLVPSDLSTLTTVDYILGSEIALLAGIALFGLIRAVRGNHRTEWQWLRRKNKGSENGTTPQVRRALIRWRW